MSEHRYPRRELMTDYARAGFGLAMTAGPLAVVPLDSLVAPVLGVLASLFAVFAGRTAIRHASRVVMDDRQLAVVGPLARSIAWNEITSLRLRYFATWPDRKGGWMQLVVRAPGGTLRLDSTLENFPVIARRAAQAARENRLTLAQATVDNLRAFGVTLETPGRGPGG